MNSDSNKLLPAYRRFYKTPVKGKTNGDKHRTRSAKN